mmetsp:Transcript_26595/g.79836  ORF Transcript_26595/g.79836 Transcript_26595/m.79836 type:complete len:261 (-) Transcript_26595:661-1443(-)
MGSMTRGPSTSVPEVVRAQLEPGAATVDPHSSDGHPVIFRAGACRVKYPLVTSKLSGNAPRHCGLSLGLPSLNSTRLPLSCHEPWPTLEQLVKASPQLGLVPVAFECSVGGGHCTPCVVRHCADGTPPGFGAVRVPLEKAQPWAAAFAEEHSVMTAAWRPALTAGYARMSVPGCPNQASDTASASPLVMMGHTRSIVAVLFMSNPRISGDDTVHHSPQWVLSSSTCDGPSAKLPISLMSGYAQQPGRLRGTGRAAASTVP